MYLMGSRSPKERPVWVGDMCRPMLIGKYQRCMRMRMMPTAIQLRPVRCDGDASYRYHYCISLLLKMPMNVTVDYNYDIYHFCIL